jgi:alpha-tubulin suppressor-like RCC1 family protein
MRRLLPLLLLCACAGSLVDHGNVGLSGPDGGGENPGVECQGGQLKCAAGCCDATAIAAGSSHTCAIAGNEARCWGANDQGQLGGGTADSYVPGKAPLTGPVSAIATGSAHTCAIAAGDVWCWGDNTFGQLGIGTSGAGTGGATPHKVPNISEAVLIAAGGAHTCAANATKTFCWGRNNFGQLGDGNLAEPPRPDPTEVPGAAGAIRLSAGDAHTCAIVGSAVRCWGSDGAGQVGNGTTTSGIPTPTSVASSDLTTSASFLGLGGNHGCAGSGSGSLSCWGANASFQVDNSGQDQKSPRGVLSGVIAVVGGANHTCAIRSSQSVRCWGNNNDFQLGSSLRNDDHADVGLSGAASAIAAGGKHSCAIVNGAAFCWGGNDRGQLGATPSASPTATPVPVSGR